MKNIYNILFAIVLTLPLLLLGSCGDNYQDTNLGNEPLELSANTNDVTLDITGPLSTAIVFNWTAGSNFNTNSAIDYIFELDIKGSDFSNSIKKYKSKGIKSVQFTTEDLNSLLLDSLGVKSNSSIELEARVKANVQDANIKPQISNIVSVTVTTYKPISSTLYIIGDAAPNGWNADKATQMNTIAGAEGGFVWQGKLSAGELKFITTLGKFLPSYGKGADGQSLVLRENEDEPDNKFIIPTTGIYKISLNIITMRINIQAMDAPEYGELWFVGNATGWSFKPMTVDASDPFIFYYNAELSAGEFKIATAPDFDDSVVFLRPEENNQSFGTNLKVVKWSSNENPNDNKWNVPEGIYKIKLDIKDMRIDIVPFTPYPMIYLIGSASPTGWSIDNADPMTATSDPFVFTWTGVLNDGELKFSCDKKNDWNGDWFLASKANAEPTGEIQQMIFSTNGSDPDNKWLISNSGTYTIELNQLQQTVIFKKQ